MEYTLTQEINAPADVVFDYLNNDKKMKEWIPELMAIEYLTPHDPQQPKGSRFVQKLKEGGRVQTYHGEVTAYLKDKHLGVRLGNRIFEADVNYHLTEIATGTRLDYRCNVQYKGWLGRLIGKLFSGFMRRMARKQMARLKQVAETKA